MKKNDLIIIAILLIIGVASYFVINMHQAKLSENDLEVQIKHNGIVIKTFPFTPQTDESFVYDDEGEDNIVQIKDGKVSIIEANCPDQICVKTQSITEAGEIIVCLPHKFTVEIVSKTYSSDIDGFSE